MTGPRRPTKAEAAELEVLREVDRARLLEVVARDPAAVPCVRSTERQAWTSDDADEQAVAARACEPCPALEACRAYGLAWPDEAGVYGGLDNLTRLRNAAQEWKENANEH